LTGFLLAGLCFVLPFVTVSCDAPGGYGRAAAGASTAYSGIDLAVGGQPDVDGALRPPAARQPDRLPVQPLALAGLLLVLAGAVVVGTVRAARTRRGTAGVLAVAGAAAVAAAVTTAQAVVETRLVEQLTVPMPAGHRAGDYVATGRGAGLCLTLLAVLGVLNLAGWWRARRSGLGGAAPAWRKRVAR
jgi:hypothetical protein